MADEDEKDLEGEEGGGGKKKLIIIIAAVALVAVAAAAAWMLMGGDEEPAGEEEVAAEEEVVRPDPIYYAFDPEFVVSLPPGGRAKMLQLSMQVMSHEQAVIDFLKQNDPMLRHHMFDLLGTRDSSALFGRKGREALAKDIEKMLEQKLQDHGLEGDIQAVYFSQLVLQ